jgi:transposase InsO family protein
MNHRKLYRLYREEGLAVRRRRGRKRATGTRAPLALPQAPDQRWSLDFVSDCFAAARRFRILVVVDDFTREGFGGGRRYVDLRHAGRARAGYAGGPARRADDDRQDSLRERGTSSRAGSIAFNWSARRVRAWARS